MSTRIAIKHSGQLWYTTGTLEDVYARLNAGDPITVWGYFGNGERWEDDIIFYGPPDFVMTDKQ